MARRCAFPLTVLHVCTLIQLVGAESSPDSQRSSAESLIETSVQLAKEEVELVEGFKTDADVQAGKASWLALKARQDEVMRALARRPDPDGKEQARLMAKYGPAMGSYRQRMALVEKRLPLVAKVNVELIRESLKAGTDEKDRRPVPPSAPK